MDFNFKSNFKYHEKFEGSVIFFGSCFFFPLSLLVHLMKHLLGLATNIVDFNFALLTPFSDVKKSLWGLHFFWDGIFFLLLGQLPLLMNMVALSMLQEYKVLIQAESSSE